MLKLQGHKGKVRALAFSPNGHQLASVAGREKRVSLWELPGGARTLSPSEPDEIQALAFDPEGEYLVVASGRYLRRWDLASGAMTDRWFRGANHVHQVAWSPDGSLLAATCFNHRGAADRFRVELFRLDKPDEKKKFLVADYGMPYCLVFSSDGRFLMAGGAPSKVRVWNMKEDGKASSWTCGGTVFAAAFAADDSVIAVSIGWDVEVYDLATRKLNGKLTSHMGYVRALAAAPDGTLLSASDDGTARLWDIDMRRERKCFDWKIGKLNAASFSPDGTLAAVGGEDGLVVWDVD